MTTDKARVRAALQDPAGRCLRIETAQAIAAALGDAGDFLRVAGALVGGERERDFVRDSQLLGIGYVASTGAALLSGVDILLPGNTYSAAGLLRQLAEVEYLSWAFAHNEAAARSWFSSTAEERRKMWQPRHLRDRSGGVFRSADYSMHCEHGGHPTPDGCRGLLNSPSQWADGLMLDTLVHASAIWSYVLSAVDTYDAETLGGRTALYPSARRQHALAAIAQWRAHDPAVPFLGIVLDHP